MFDATPLGAKAAAFVLSISMHVAVAAVAVNRGSGATTAGPVEEHLVDVMALDVDASSDSLATTERTEERPLPSHAHPYAVPRQHDAGPHGPSQPHRDAATDDHGSSIAAAPTVVEATQPSPPRFVMTVGNAGSALGGDTAISGRGHGRGALAADEPVAETTVDTPAKLLQGNPPAYTQEAEAAGVEADVPLEIVVDATGEVVKARYLTRVGYGLDEAALLGIRAYRFTPARRDGRPAAVRMKWLMRFQLR